MKSQNCWIHCWRKTLSQILRFHANHCHNILKCAQLYQLKQTTFSLKWKNGLWQSWLMVTVQMSLLTNKISEWFGLVSPSIRYVVHAADGSLKRLTNSKTMNVSGISEFVLPFRTILCHFHQSERSTCLLIKHLESGHENCSHDAILLDKSGLSAFCMHTSSWPTFTYMWCSYISWHQKGSNIFLSPKLMIIMHLLAYLETVFQQEFLKPFNHDDGTIITAYQVAEWFADQIRDHFQPKKLENFLNNLSKDNNGNILLNIQLNEDHFLTLNYNHHWDCNVEISKIDSIKNLASSYREKLVCNSQKDNLEELASGFDLSRPISLGERTNYLRNYILCLEQTTSIMSTTIWFVILNKLKSGKPSKSASFTNTKLNVMRQKYWESFKTYGLYLTEFGQNTAMIKDRSHQVLWSHIMQLHRHS